MSDADRGLREGWLEEPLASRLRSTHPHRDEILRRHRAAVEQGLPVYTDPVSRLSVFTADFLARRGWCCRSGCRHCPFAVD